MRSTSCRHVLCATALGFATALVTVGPLEAGVAGMPAAFVRGDTNADGNTDLTDGIVILTRLFLGGDEPGCADAYDSNDSGGIDLTDAVFLFNFLFLGGQAPPAPFERCGSDPTRDTLGCVEFSPCEASACEGDPDCALDSYCRRESCDAPEGQCEVRPQGCPDVWDPVCGCDGVTYGNSCEAAAVGQSIDHVGECLVPEGCETNDDCDDVSYCRKESCDDLAGTCESRPVVCTEEFDPVCGCDGITYSNACFAASAGQNLRSEGECPIDQGDCVSNDDCDEVAYCEKERCEDELGVCVVRPRACTREFDPVCGCDGRTYPNPCNAAASGVNVRSRGECRDIPPGVCEGNFDCDAEEFCERADCDDELGTCVARPDACDDVFDPVCGCDGETYGNACQAAVAGVSVASEGECPDQGNNCITNDDCGFGEMCFKESCDLDVGSCELIPDLCPAVVDPVCGCDGVTYNNSCEAMRAGVNVENDEACRPR